MASSLANSCGIYPTTSLPAIAEDYIENPKGMYRRDFRKKKVNNKKNRKKTRKIQVKPHSFCCRRNGTSMFQVENTITFTPFTYFPNIVPHSAVGNVSVLRDVDGKEATKIVQELLNSLCTSKVILKGKELILWILDKCKELFECDLYKYMEKVIRKNYLWMTDTFNNITLENINTMLSQILTDWEACKRNPAFSAVLTLLTVVIAYFYGKEAKKVIGIGALSFITLDASKACESTSTIFESILVVTKAVTNGVVKYKMDGSLLGFIYGDEPLTNFMSQVTEMANLHQSFIPGNLEMHHDIKVNEYEFKLRKAISQGRKLLHIYTGAAKSTVTSNLQKLESMLNDVILEKSKGGLRECPFAISVFGSSGVGKSTVNEILLRSILMSNGFDHRKDYIAYLNANDKYLSNFKTFTLAAVIDDAANTKTQFSETAFSSLMISLVNNAPFVLNKADIAEKGKVTALLKVLGVTTNVPVLEADVTSNMPSSVVRRFLHVKVEVKPEFRKLGSLCLDSEKVVKTFGEDLFPDVWQLTLYEIKIESIARDNPKMAQKDDSWNFEIINHNGLKCENIGIKDAVNVLTEKSTKFFEVQKIVVRNSEEWDRTIVCKTCKHVKGSYMCECVRDDTTPHSHIELEVNNWKNTFREFAMSTVSDRRSAFHNWMLSRTCDVSQFTRDVLEFSFKVFDNYVETNKILLRELLIPNMLDNGILGSYTSRAFRSESKYFRMLQSAMCLIPAAVGLVSDYFAPTSNICGLMTTLCCFSLFAVNSQTVFNTGMKLRRVYEFCARHSNKVLMGILGCSAVLLHKRPITLAIVHGICTWKMKKSVESCMSDYFKDKKQNVNTDATALLAGTIGSMYFKEELHILFKDIGSIFKTSPHTALNPDESEIIERDMKKGFDEEWFATKKKKILDKLPVSTIRTTEEVQFAISENVWKVSRLNPNEKTNALILKSGFVLVPWHFVKDQTEGTTLTFTRHNRGNIGNGKFTCIFHPSQSVRIRDSDVALCWIPNTQSVRNIETYFPLEHICFQGVQDALVFTRNSNGDLRKSRARNVVLIDNAHSGCGYSFKGASYVWNECDPGTCMSPIVSLTDRACILALHVGGDKYSKQCFGSTVTQEELREAEAKLLKFPSVIPMSALADFPERIYDKPVIECDLKRKSIILRHPESTVTCFGSSMNVNRTPKSQVRNLKMKGRVRQIFNIAEDWGSPKFFGKDGKSRYEPWELGFQKWTKSKIGLPFGLLNKAVIDYKNDIMQVILRRPEFWKKEVRVLTWDETINGIPGKRFVGPINFSSSVGYPLKGSKNDFSVNHGQFQDWQDYRTLDPMIMERAKHIEDLYAQGKRSYDIYTSTLKDEPTLTSKDKVRVFQASSIANQLVIRKYCLNICRLLQLNPLVSECAVGIDPKSKEWHELAVHLRATQSLVRSEKYLAMDYKEFDTSICPQMILAIGGIFHSLAQYLGYTERELAVLNGIFGELAFPVVDFNGDILMLDGANPSGNPLTVFINNITNSLSLRMFWYTLYSEKFQRNVHIICYGDDIVGSVKSGFSGFNMCSYRDWIGMYGLKVTAADKDSELKPYARFKELDFLKRKFEWSKELQRYVGPIQESSIYRSLCQYMKSDTDEMLIAASNIDGALDEWFLHGRNVYEDRAQKLRQIAKEFGYDCLCNRLHLTYDQRKDLF